MNKLRVSIKMKYNQQIICPFTHSKNDIHLLLIRSLLLLAGNINFNMSWLLF